jgi:ABC-type glutathione transport system ATPase component
MAGEDGFTNGRGSGALQVEMAMEEGRMFSTSNRGGEKSFPSPEQQLKLPPTQPESDRLYNLAVNNLSYKVKIKVNKVAQDKILLNNVTARANHSEMLAVVGPSGSSKTTFLDAMAGRIDRRSLSGQILVNQSPMDATFKRVSGYVMQDDALFPHLTTRETLMFSARLRLPGNMSNQEKARRVDSLIQQLGLVECANTYVGDEKVLPVTSPPFVLFFRYLS